MKTKNYTRIVGAAPQIAKLNNGVIADLSGMIESFGAPEIYGANGEWILFWNFSPSRESRRYFTAYCHVPSAVKLNGKLTVEVRTKANKPGADFFDWFASRHLAVTNNAEAPHLFAGNGSAFILSRPTV